MDWLIKGALAAAAFVVATVATKEITGKHIHEHALDAWNTLRDSILAWAHENAQLGVVGFMAWLDNRVSAVARLVVRAKTDQGMVVVTEEEVDLEEALAMLPGLRDREELDITELVLT